MTSPQDHAQANSVEAASAPPVSKVATAPVVAPAPALAARAKPAKPSGPTHTQLIAMRLTARAEAEYSNQNFTAAIANCKAAVELWPGYRRAHQLLQQSEQAQQAAMNSIKIH
jgi:Meckel syndrome type 1 protein